MENVLFTITVDNTITVWAPINSWEPHILYQRTSISMSDSELHSSIPTEQCLSSFCILIDSAELTRALETIFNRLNGTDIANSDRLARIAEIARKSPEVCLVLNQNDDSLRVWGIDVFFFQRISLIDEASGL